VSEIKLNQAQAQAQNQAQAMHGVWDKIYILLPKSLPQSLLGRLSLVMVCGVLLTQLVATAIWSSQQLTKSEIEVKTASEYLAHSASSSIRFFRAYRQIIASIDQAVSRNGRHPFLCANQSCVCTSAGNPDTGFGAGWF